MRTVLGIPASTGVARGPWIVIAASAVPAGGRIAPGQAEAELERLVVARDAAAAELEALAAELTSAGRDEGEIFDAQAMMARDPSLLDAAATTISEGHDAIGAIRSAAEGVAAQLRALGDELLAARAADVLDVAERIAARLAGVDRTVALDGPSIVVAEDIPPSIAASLPRDLLLGMALQSGSATSHAAILARAFGIPAVVGAAGLLDAARSTDGAAGGVAVVDGDSGEVVFEPDSATANRLEGRRAAARRGRPPGARGGVAAGSDPRRSRGHAPRQHRDAGRGRAGGRARRSGRRPVPHRVPVRRAGRSADRGGAGCGQPRGRRGVRAGTRDDPPARCRRRQADPVAADPARGQPVPRGSSVAPRRRAAGHLHHPAPGRDARRGRRRPRQGDGADGRGRGRRRRAPRPGRACPGGTRRGGPPPRRGRPGRDAGDPLGGPGGADLLRHGSGSPASAPTTCSSTRSPPIGATRRSSATGIRSTRRCCASSPPPGRTRRRPVSSCRSAERWAATRRQRWRSSGSASPS